MGRNGLLSFLIVVFLVASGLSAAADSFSDRSSYAGESAAHQHRKSIPATNDLFIEALAIKQNRRPILIMFGADDCTYCEKLEEEILKPMLKSGEYEDRVIIRKVMIDSFEDMRDFNGSRIGSHDFAEKYHVSVTPTVILMDSNGQVLAPEILGINTVEFYSAYLDQAIDFSFDALNSSRN